MKKTIRSLLLLGSLCIFGLTSCEKVKDKLFPAFETEIADVSVTIPVTIAGVGSSSSGNIYFNLDSTIKAYTANTFSFNNLSSVKVKDVSVFLLNTDNLNDISNFESVSLELFSNTNRTPSVIVSTFIPNKPATNINIPATNSPELKDYLWGDMLTYTVNGKARRSTTKPLKATVSVTLSVK